jgi:hypothetical protein
MPSLSRVKDDGNEGKEGKNGKIIGNENVFLKDKKKI